MNAADRNHLRLLEDHEFEVDLLNSDVLVQLTDVQRFIVCYLSVRTGCGQGGVAGIACRLVERHCSRLAADAVRTFVGSVPRWEFFTTEYSQFLLMASAAVKICGEHYLGRDAVLVQDLLELTTHMGIMYSPDDISRQEHQIYFSLKFRLPTATGVGAALALAAAAGLPNEYAAAVANMVDFAETIRNYVLFELKSLGLSPTPGRRKLATLHLSAAGAVAAAWLLQLPAPAGGWELPLARAARAPPHYVAQAAHILVHQYNQMCDMLANLQPGPSQDM